MSLLRLWIVSPFKNRIIVKGFVLQDIQGRFAGSMGGVFWTVLLPIANISIYVFVFSMVMKIRVPVVETGTGSFAVFLLTGLFPWMAFSEALIRSTTLLPEKAGIITKVMFPVEILPFVCVIVPFILNAAGFAVLLCYLAVKGYAGFAWFLLPIAVLPHMAFTLGLTAFLAALAVFLRDIQQVMSVVLNLWMYLTPIIYPLSMVPEFFRRLMFFNPVYPFIDLYRQILLHHSISGVTCLIAFIWSASLFCFGGWFFMKIKHAFGDVL